ncbi:GntR family transcriptional regulator [Pseudahrensia aquimaris]|uniref:GntR family transcriptional regulator n=1 Tax=Pseudahrensia aquimaris TaxID=744461 RepID=A0ABW3FGQ4_9HYPH
MSETLTPFSARPGRLPLHVQVSELLARDIQAGILADGEKLEPEREMAAQLGVAVGTLRKALGDLTEKGLLERVQGSGNYVRRSKEAQTIYGFFHLEKIGGGGLPSADVLSVDAMEKPDDLPHFGRSKEVLRIRRLRRLSGVDAALEEIWLDGRFSQGVDMRDLPDSLYVYYRERLGLWVMRAEDSVSVAPVPDWRPDGFGSEEPAIWGYVERQGFDPENVSAEYSRTWFDPSTTRYIARWS